MGASADRIAAIRSPYSPCPDNRVKLLVGDHVAVELPFSEAMMAARKAGQVWTVRLGFSSAQLIDPCGHEWGGPYLPCEVGIYGDLHSGYYGYGIVRRVPSHDDRPHHCPYAWCDTLHANRAAMVEHLHDAHGLARS